ncbi:MAG: glycosyltransferase family protein [Ignavibacteriaceae bacterium]
MIPSEVNKYLQKYSLSKWTAERSGFGKINTVVVIPAISEYENIKELLFSLSENDPEYFNSTLIMFVVNNLASSGEEVKKENKNTLEFLRSVVKKDFKNENKLTDRIISSGLNIAIVDASTEGKELPDKDGGVGLARKIGMDLALNIFDYKDNKKKILICLDADCAVGKNYLSEIIENFNQHNLSAAVVNYEHIINKSDETAAAIICYEIFLRYYVLGLNYAFSPYAFHTIGSTMACSYESYVKVEGMNKKKAAEDFYFLEKLAKNVKVENIKGTKVYPSNRKSWRVPFGTGQRVIRFLSNVQDEYLLYDPKSFYILKKWLEAFNSLTNVNANAYLEAAKKNDGELFNFLIEQNFEMNWNKVLKNSVNEKQLSLQKMRWFDGFKTLKLIHYLRDSAYPMVNMFDALDDLLGRSGINSLTKGKNNPLPSIEIQKEYLNALRKLT